MACIFCEIVKGNVPSYKIWEDDKHIAFLSIFPNTDGVTVVTTKAHYPSYVFDLPDEVISDLILASKKVAKIIDSKFDDVGRTALVFEGFGVDHIHAKLFPMHGTKLKSWKPLESSVNFFFEKYPGYISSNDSKREDDSKLEEIQNKLIH